ncbi:MAG: beta-N-acetylhexosaminidase, partial [Pseudomonadota bacterium]|nr:beta-N-acetylhexosaminidase [Pseudomonadota bacterium]
NHPKALIIGLDGPILTDAERLLLVKGNPLGIILFARNCKSPDQLRALTGEVRTLLGRADAPILIDYEGGRVRQLCDPVWPVFPAAALYGEIYARDPKRAVRMVRRAYRLVGQMLADVGIDVDCAPVLDLPTPGAHDVIGRRAFASDPDRIAAMAGAACAGLLDAGVLPVVKHIPGHGRALADSHKALPVVDTDAATLEKTDFVPFRALCRAPWGMTAHILYSAFDNALPATISPTVVGDVIRRQIGFDGLLVSDDLDMKALSGSHEKKALAMLAAGVDIVLHCSGDTDAASRLVTVVPPIGPETAARLVRGQAMRMMRQKPPVDFARAYSRLMTEMAGYTHHDPTNPDVGYHPD